jgi:hypothetical protein
MKKALLLFATLLSFNAWAVEPYAILSVGATKLDARDASGSFLSVADESAKETGAIGVGVTLTPVLSLETSYQVMGKVSANSAGTTLDLGCMCQVNYTATASGRVQGINMSAVIRYPATVSPYLRVGGFFDMSRYEWTQVQSNGVTVGASRSSRGAKTLLGAGVSYKRLAVEYGYVDDVNLWSFSEPRMHTLMLTYRHPL